MLFHSFNEYLKGKYGCRVHRLSLNAGFPCPNKNGAGCVFCNEEAFSPTAGISAPIEEQIELAMERMSARTGAKKFIAYFQTSTGTNAEVSLLREKYDVIRKYPEIVGLFISTRPDCVDDEKLDLIASYGADHEVWIEYGMQSANDNTLFRMGRGHTHSQTVRAVEMSFSRGIKVGVHLVLGFPGETHADMMVTAGEVSRMPVSGIKLHVLHVLKNTPLEKDFMEGNVPLMSREVYVGTVCDLLERIPPEVVVFRLVSDARPDVLVAPSWINNKLAVIEMVKKEFVSRGTRQGYRYEGISG